MTLGQEKRTNYVAQLRRLADLVEANPTMSCPYFGVAVISCENIEKMRFIAKTIGGKWDKSADATTFDLNQKICDGLRIILFASRKDVCKRIVTGTRVIPATTLPAREEIVIPAREEEVVEWICPEVMNGSQEPSVVGLASEPVLEGGENPPSVLDSERAL